MRAALFFHIAGHLVAAGMSAWMAGIALSRPHIPGGRAFGNMNLAMVWWCLTGALHGFPQAVEARVVWATLQVAGIAAVPPLWLLFAGGYARAPWAARRRVRRGLLAAAVLMVGVAATNSRHGLYWPGMQQSGAYLSYEHGPLFWAAVAWNYTLILLGAVTLLRALRLQHRAFTGQVAALIGATLCPWLGNILYLLGVFPPGFDPTAFTFVFSGALITWGLYSHQLFDLVPAGRAAVFERMLDPVLVFDRAFRVIDLNAAAAALLGVPPAGRETGTEVLGRHPSELFDWWSRVDRPASSDEPVSVTVVDEGRILDVELTPFLGGQSGGSLLVIRDVTARRRAEFDHIALEKKLHEQRRIESLTVMAAGLAHDFNNLLTAILGNADYITATSDERSEQRASAEAIATAAQHAADLVSQMVAFSGQGRTFVGPIALEDAVSDVIRALSRTLGERAMVTHESAPDLPPLPGDVVQIRQAVLALLTNAVDAVAERHGSVEVTTGRETLDAAALAAATYSAARPGDFLFVDVRDDGSGMLPEVLQRVFEPFFSTRDLGRGLGLAAVHGIVRSHQGAIRFWTAPGQGTRVRVWWPLS